MTIKKKTPLDIESVAALVRAELPSDEYRVRVVPRDDDDDARGRLYVEQIAPSEGRADPHVYAGLSFGRTGSYLGKSRWEITNFAGHSQRDTRVFGISPDAAKVARSIVDVARKRASAISAREESWRKRLAADEVDENARFRACAALGRDPEDYRLMGPGGLRVAGYNGTGLVVVRLGHTEYELLCWPHEAPEALATLEAFAAKVKTFGREENKARP
jgi:hypothetical protein